MAVFTRNVFVMAILFFSVLSFTEARDHLVGGKTNSWKIPSSESDSLNRWAEKTRFLVGDSLVWKYDGAKDSVLEVSKKDYVTCNTSSPIAMHNDGNTKIVLEHFGAYYFISGVKGSCEQGQKLVVVTLSKRRYADAPVPSPVEFDGPAIAPTSNGFSLKASLVVAFGVLVGFWL